MASVFNQKWQKKIGGKVAYQSPLPKSQKSARFVHLVGYIYYSYI